MYKKLLIIIPVLIVAAGAFFYLWGNSEKINWANVTEGFQQSKREGKKVLISVYTDWCPYCKQMESDVYSNAKVIEYINKNFVAIKLNGESKDEAVFEGKKYEELEIAGGLGVTSYPTTIFFDQKGQALAKIPGYIDKNTFMLMLEFVKEEKYYKQSFDEYMKGKH
jgi:thioredoxin-related protein